MPVNAFQFDSSTAAGEIVKIIGVLAGTFLLLFSFFFFCISIIAVMAGIKQTTFSLNWWAFVFPNAGLTLALIQLGGVFNSPGINGICSALTIMLVIMWIITAVAHFRAVWSRNVLWPGKDEDQDR